jgi:tetratricopeptide (TPR) repeat protein
MSKIFTSLSLVLTLATASTAQAAFWAQQQTAATENSGKVQVTVSDAKPTPTVKTKPHISPRASIKANDLTLEQVLVKQQGLTDTQQVQLWQRYLKSSAATPCGKLLAYGNLGEIQANMQQYTQSLQTYEHVLAAFPADQCSNGSFVIAASLNGKGYVLGKLERKDEALDYFKSIPKIYNLKQYPNLKSVHLSALSNTAEISLIVGNKVQALEYAQKANKLAVKNDDTYAIMPFLLWLMNNKTEQDVLKAINALSPDVEYSWDWNDIPPVIQQLPAKRQAKANCFIDFFNNHHDKARVKACIAQY